MAAARGYTGLTAYSASKGGVNGMVRALALELAPEIRVNIVMPGSVATDVGRHWAEELGTEFVARTSPSAEEESYRWLGDPIQLAHAHLWLASEDSSFVTGQEIPVDGGRSVGGKGLLNHRLIRYVATGSGSGLSRSPDGAAGVTRHRRSPDVP